MSRIITLSFALLLLSWPARSAEPPVVPLVHGHAHNDYEHARPLFEALEQGFCSVEADVWLVDGQLLVAHDREKVKPERTLQSLYLDPLRVRVRQNGGRVYRGGPGVTLLVDVKSDAEATYAALKPVLAQYQDLLTAFHGPATVTNAITVIISGNRARTTMAMEPARLAAYDGRLEDLDGDAPANLIPLVSASWSPTFKWRGEGEFPADEKARLAQFAAQAHAQGRRLRLWGAKDVPALWRAQRAAGVDLINTDRLVELKEFLAAPPVPGEVPRANRP